MGYRLPLDSLPWVSAGDYSYQVEADPFAPRGALPSAARIRGQYAPHAVGGGFAEGGTVAMQAQPGLSTGVGCTAGRVGPGKPLETPRWRTCRSVSSRPTGSHARPSWWRPAIRAAQTVRRPRRRARRAACSYVFMPPLQLLEDYLQLPAAVEATAAELGVKIVLEGYPPPRDQRLKLLQVTPDPGVIEVNIHPAHDWAELAEHTEFLYDAAWRSRLSTEKFMLDGGHTGTGGGNHFVLGGAMAADSPFLRRPDLLASQLAYCHNHPSLSYLFSGLFRAARDRYSASTSRAVAPPAASSSRPCACLRTWPTSAMPSPW